MDMSCLTHQKLFRRLSCLLALAGLTAVLAGAGTAHASFTWQGGNWGGRDFTPGNGDILSGTFTDIGHLVIGTGDTVYAGSGVVSLTARDAVINGSLYGGSVLSPSLFIDSATTITLNGKLDQWTSITLDAGTSVTLSPGSYISGIGGPSGGTGTVNLPAGGSLSIGSGSINLPAGGAMTVNLPVGGATISNLPGGGILTLAPVPLPPALFLLGPALAFVGMLRRVIP